METKWGKIKFAFSVTLILVVLFTLITCSPSYRIVGIVVRGSDGKPIAQGKALEFMIFMAEEGHAETQLLLGLVYLYGGQGIPKDYKKTQLSLRDRHNKGLHHHMYDCQ